MEIINCMSLLFELVECEEPEAIDQSSDTCPMDIDTPEYNPSEITDRIKFLIEQFETNDPGSRDEIFESLDELNAYLTVV